MLFVTTQYNLRKIIECFTSYSRLIPKVCIFSIKNSSEKLAESYDVLVIGINYFILLKRDSASFYFRGITKDLREKVGGIFKIERYKKKVL